METNEKVRCAECGYIHPTSARDKKQIGDFTCNYCPICGEESYYLIQKIEITETVQSEMDKYDSLEKIVQQLEMSVYECEGGYLMNNTAFLKLKQLAGLI